jgi:hypothetical protein
MSVPTIKQGGDGREPPVHPEGAVRGIVRMDLDELVPGQGEAGTGSRVIGVGRAIPGNEGIKGVVAPAEKETDESAVFAGCGEVRSSDAACQIEIEQGIQHRQAADRSTAGLAQKTAAGTGKSIHDWRMKQEGK